MFFLAEDPEATIFRLFREGEIMKRSITRKILAVGLFLGLMGFSVQADLGLMQILSSEGVKAVGVAVKAEAEAIYASTDDVAVIQEKLTGLMNEAVATGDTQAIRYAIIAVMLTGGTENLALSKAAVDDSEAFDKFPDVTALTVSAMEKLLSGTTSTAGKFAGLESGGEGGAQGGGGGGAQGGGGDELGGGDEQGGEQGGGDSGWWDLFDPDIDDLDIDATRV